MLLVTRSEDISFYIFVHTYSYSTGSYLKFSIIILNNINEYLFLIFNEILFYSIFK